MARRFEVTLNMDADAGITLTREDGDELANIPARFIMDNELFDEFRDDFISYHRECTALEKVIDALLYARGLKVDRSMYSAISEMCVPGPGYDFDPGKYTFMLEEVS